MDNGLGRTGYLLLATVLLLFGGLGLGTAYLAIQEGSPRFFELGLGLGAVAMVGLFGFAFYAPWLVTGQPMVPRPKRKPQAAEPAPTEPVAAPGPSGKAPEPAVDLGFEYNDAEPAAKAAPDQLVVPPAFVPSGAGRDPAAWPERRGSRPTGRPGTEKSDWTVKMEQKARVADMVEDSHRRQELKDRYTAETPLVRAAMSEPPMHVAERAPEGMGPGFAAPGLSVGQCGRCKTVVMAPDQRPLRLKCPECAKVTLLN